MLKGFYLCSIFFCWAFACYTQSLPEQDCIAAIPVCQDTFVQNTPYSGSGAIPNEINNNSSCLITGEVNDVWYTFTVQSAGDLCFSIVPNDLTDDYDWAVFNLSNAPCDNIFTDSSLEVSCNFSSLTGITGANNLSGTQNEPCIPVAAGGTYVINVSQFTPSVNGYTLDFSASTAQLYDNIPPELDSVYTPITCGDSQIVITFTENVICSTVQPGDFILSGPSGNISITNITSDACVNGSTYDDQFTLTVSPAIAPGGSFSLTLLANAAVEDLCNNPNIAANTENFTVLLYTTQITTTPQLCSSSNGTATALPDGGLSPYVYSWNTVPAQNNSTATGLIPGAYTVTVTDAVGCTSNGSGMVGFDPGANPPVATISSFSNASCSGMNDGSATVSITGGSTPYVIIWSNTQTTQSVTGLSTGTIICTVTDNNGCYDTAAVTISGGVPIFITANPDTFICKGTSATLTASVSGGSNPFTYTWLKNGIVDGTNIPYVVSPSVTTVYSVVATDNAGCMSDTDVVTVNVYPPIDVTISPVNIVCLGDSVKLKANVSGGKGSGYNYVWSNTAATGSEIYVKPPANTTYTVTVTDGCTVTPGIASVDVNIGQPPPTMKIFADPLVGCIPLNVQFHIEPYIQGYIYMWDFGDGNLMNTTLDTVNNTYIIQDCRDVKLSIITNEGCLDSIIDTCMISPYPSPKADFIYSPANPTTLNPIVNFYDRSSGAASWQWNLGDNAIANGQVVQHEYPDSGTYTVRLVSSNSYLCTDTVLHKVFIDYETAIYFPNCFSPNEDELNDYFAPVFEGVSRDGFMMYIFNRWGNLIYQTDNFNNPWDGKLNGQYVNDGVYMYYIRYKTFSGEEKKIRGSVTLLK